MIFVTGASGRMGGAVVAHAKGRVRTRAGTRAARDIPGADETARFDIHEPASFPAALGGCDALFLMRPPTVAARKPFDALMAAAKQAGVKHVVCASVWGAEKSRVLPHRHMEAAVRESGLACTILRPADFMQNLADLHADAIVRRHELALPAGLGRSAFLDAEDVGPAALAAFADPAAHAGQAYGLAGPEELAFADVARIIDETLGVPVTYRPISVPRFIFEQVRAGRPVKLALVMSALYLAQRIGMAATVRDDFERLAGRKPGSLAAYLDRERARFGAPSASSAV